ncbi:hypothetical protein ACH4T9_12610 [Micromonospora sp. NPDC020750]|uniref:hypothetical protein n=1 Tax=unclassified Micromonospora TaxID=2617518 RepID=UPI00379EB8C3
MPLPSIEPSVDHAQAVAAMLRTGTAFQVHEGDVNIPDDELTWPHYVVWGAAGNPSVVRLAGDGGEVWTRTQITCVGLSPLDVLGAADRARRVLHRKRPTITGRRCGDIEQDPGSPGPPAVDPNVKSPDGRRIYFTPIFFTLHSSPIRSTT